MFNCNDDDENDDDDDDDYVHIVDDGFCFLRLPVRVLSGVGSILFPWLFWIFLIFDWGGGGMFKKSEGMGVGTNVSLIPFLCGGGVFLKIIPEYCNE